MLIPIIQDLYIGDAFAAINCGTIVNLGIRTVINLVNEYLLPEECDGVIDEILYSITSYERDMHEFPTLRNSLDKIVKDIHSSLTAGKKVVIISGLYKRTLSSAQLVAGYYLIKYKKKDPTTVVDFIIEQVRATVNLSPDDVFPNYSFKKLLHETIPSAS